MRRPRLHIPQRRRIFLGCEGESERSYGALLARLIEKHHRRIHLDTVLLQPGAGDSLALIERAVRQIANRSDRNNPYTSRAVLIDGDMRTSRPERAARAVELARGNDIRIIWQEPCHEAFLLRHFEGCATLRPADTRQAEDALRRRWPEYRKALPAARLAAVITKTGVLRAANSEPDLDGFLTDIDFVRD